MEERAKTGVSFSPIVVLAALSVMALIGVSAWQGFSSWKSSQVTSGDLNEIRVTTNSAKSRVDWQRAFADTLEDSAASSTIDDPDGLSNIGGNVMGTLLGAYATMKDAGTYTQSRGEEIAGAIAEDLRASISYRMYSASDAQIDESVSLPRMLAYRNDMRVAFEPLLLNSMYELEIFAYYLDTHDAQYLEELRRVAENYRTATENVLGVTVPKDAVSYHVGTLNALSEFEAVLNAMAAHADDPFATAALLRTFNEAEAGMFFSFNSLAGYFREYPRS